MQSVSGRVVAAFALGLLAACGDDPVAAPSLATQLELSATAARIEVGEPLTITAVARDARDSVVANPSIVWSATPGAVATVADGVVTGVSPGTAVIQATVQSASASLMIDVVPATAATLLLTAPSATLAPSASVTITAVVRDARQAPLSGRVVTWTSSDTRVVSVGSGGVATAVAPGTAYVVARSDGVRDSLLLTVSGSALTLETSPGDVEVRVGRTRTLAARTRDISGTLAIPDGVTWTSDNVQVATVTGGVVTGVALGTTIIRAQSGAMTAATTVRVSPGGVVYTVGTTTTNEAVIRADSIHIGGTLTATGPLTLVSSGDIVIVGSIIAPCHALTLLAGGRVLVLPQGLELSIPGIPRIDNACAVSAATDPAPDLGIEAFGGYQIFNANVRSSGNITVTNDPGLLTANFVGAPIGRASENCVMRAVSMNQQSVAAAIAGASGRDGAHIDVACRGSFRAAFVNMNARGGMHGGASAGDVDARGGDGGGAGSVRFRVTGDLTVDVRRLHFRSFAAGNGGDATAVRAGNNGGHANAIGGRGGDAGSPDRAPIEFRVAGDVIDNDPTDANVIEIGIFGAGHGGDAVATAAAGASATDAQPAGAGGSATAIAGRAGDAHAAIVTVGGTMAQEALLLLGQSAGDGGSATAAGGRGGDGSAAFPNGAPGGSARVEGGDGGTTTGVNSSRGQPSSGGDGGAAMVSGSEGGAGFDRCSPAGAGGIGGFGGTITGYDGRAGSGQTNATSLGITISAAANGGRGGAGATPGAGGRAGSDATQSRGPRTVSPPSFTAGAIGGACPAPPP